MARQFSTGTKFGGEKGKVQKPARIPPQDLAPRGREISRGKANPFPQKNSLPRRVQISFQGFAQKKSGFCPKYTANWEMKSLARPLRGLASRFSGKFSFDFAQDGEPVEPQAVLNEVKAKSGLFLIGLKKNKFSIIIIGNRVEHLL